MYKLKFLIYCSAELAVSQHYLGNPPATRRSNTPLGILKGHKKKRETETSPAAAALCIIKYTALLHYFHRNPWMYKQN